MNFSDLSYEFEPFTIFNIDLGIALGKNKDGELNRPDLLGVMLWEITQKGEDKGLTIDQLRALAKQERAERAEQIAVLVEQGLTVDYALVRLPVPKYVDWAETE